MNQSLPSVPRIALEVVVTAPNVPGRPSIRSVRANGRQLHSVANLAPRTTDLQIGYTALSLAVPEKVHFWYRLEEEFHWREAAF
jgi:hypothetical protein